MTEKEKRTILDMRAAGKQYNEISAELGIEVSALKVFVHRQKHNDVRQCDQCKKVLPMDARKTQRFCSDKQKFLQKNEQYPLSLVFVSEEPNVQVIRVGEGSSRSGTHPP